ncbi:beta-N-acetylhexosaminidase [Microbulbifer halophilus]|uniref:beta-N-acetylhexosaminidase n=2 Tax=Microbulbifer halophilus TaxID=453963 RepID=A0ABW5EE72_9GAMM|nr:family 20 glycosylhydrolase [Microbulbifer halophilus]MCW8125731.1 family 20 glycosylhydrolase [Microbulbifer halophilus]
MFVSAANALGKEPLALMPYPQQFQRQQGQLQLGGELALEVRGPASARLDGALERFRQRLRRQSGIELRGGTQAAAKLTVEIARESAAITRLQQIQPPAEGYRLRVGAEGIQLRAETDLGALRGLQTLLQLIGDGGQLAAISVEDQPRFRWRGLLIDSVRHFFSVDTIKRQLDGMAAAKLNIFHWHLTDDQGWRLESRHYPKLHKLASNGHYYSREQIREVVDYARARGIVVVPEIDLPGHASAIAVAYPELMSAPGPYEPEERWGVHTPLLNPADERVYEFAGKILAEVAELFPFEYVHIGGDEVNPRDWLENPQIQALMRKQKLPEPADLHNYFNGRIAAILRKLDRRMIGWDEVLHENLASGTAVQSWRGPDALGNIARAGHPAILSTGFYLDQPQTAAYHYRNRLLLAPYEFRLAERETWQRRQFTLPRKRGSAIEGSFTLVEKPSGEMRGFIDFSGKSRRPLHSIDTRHGITRFELDTWMGPLEARLDLGGTKLRGDMLVGNVAYTAGGQLIGGSQLEGTSIPAALPAPRLSERQKQNILGGEAALWSEMVDENSIDLRLWPRAFAVAERLWSPRTLRDQASLYRRLPQVSRWAAESTGLKHRQQQREALAKLVSDDHFEAALVLSEALEPAHYYHRHHEKSVHESYSRRDPLNRFVDSLPAESFAVRELQKNIDQWLASPGAEYLQALDARLIRWRDSAETLRRPDQPDADIRRLAQQLYRVSDRGIALIELLQAGESPDADTAASIRAQLREAQQMHGEAVVAAAYPLERLLDASY